MAPWGVTSFAGFDFQSFHDLVAFSLPVINVASNGDHHQL